MKINKVFTFGCSFSDYMWKVTKTYGQYTAEELNAEYIHEGSGCGSNERIFRKFFEYLRNGDINKETLVTLQFTEPSREEIWFNEYVKEDADGHHGGMPFIERFDDGGIFKYKWDSYKWNNNKNISRIMKDKTDYCYSNQFYVSKTKNIMYSIIEVCKSKEIPFVVLNGGYNRDYLNYKDETEFLVVEYQDIQQNYPTYLYDTTEFDFSHLSQEVHIELGKKILNKLEL